MKSLAVIMITKNEEYHIGAAIDNIKDIASEIFILDSFSNDKTCEIAKEKGAVIKQRIFTNFGDQWNYALNCFPVKSDLTMKLDPDERLSEELKVQIIKILKKKQLERGGYCFYRRLWFMGKPIGVKQKILRIWPTGTCRFSKMEVNEQPIVEGRHCFLSGYMEHLDSKNLYEWTNKQNKYSNLEAKYLHEYTFFDKTNLSLKLKLKKYMYWIPGIFSMIYFYNLFIKQAWKGGKEGIIWAHLRTEIYRMRYYKYLEMKRIGKY